MITVALLALAWIALLIWVTGLYDPGCQHAHLKGVANYYDKDLHAFIHLKECEDCGLAIITHER